MWTIYRQMHVNWTFHNTNITQSKWNFFQTLIKFLAFETRAGVLALKPTACSHTLMKLWEFIVITLPQIRGCGLLIWSAILFAPFPHTVELLEHQLNVNVHIFPLLRLIKLTFCSELLWPLAIINEVRGSVFYFQSWYATFVYICF